MSKITEKEEFIKKYYGETLQRTDDLQTSACCCSDDLLHPLIKEISAEINDEVLAKYYGCGSPIPPALEGATILDLGCGTGKDVYIAARLAGPEGFAIGVDMTEEQLEVADRHLAGQMKTFGYDKPNVKFIKGYIEDLSVLGLEDNSIDVVISNCVFNLSQDKEKALKEVFRVLKPGGELYFSDVFSGRRIPKEISDDHLLHSECLGGAMYTEDFRRLMRNLGCMDFRIVAQKRIRPGNAVIEAKLGMIDFYSITVRAFKLETLEDICEDYGQVAVYRGTIRGYPHYFDLDDHHRLITGKPMLVCGNTASMLQETRYAPHFRVSGDRSVHYGPFNCAPAYSKKDEGSDSGGACC
ncbi:MAG: methyltransferase domain-containing protein [Nitrospira sp.]|nr:methyltransferase domain-containing protein [bacterium]MBL7049797.1 methyltransferase domain-containing protein [Nitrospira sp.]